MYYKVYEEYLCILYFVFQRIKYEISYEFNDLYFRII